MSIEFTQLEAQMAYFPLPLVVRSMLLWHDNQATVACLLNVDFNFAPTTEFL
jgi:hypothetical protein